MYVLLQNDAFLLPSCRMQSLNFTTCAGTNKTRFTNHAFGFMVFPLAAAHTHDLFYSNHTVIHHCAQNDAHTASMATQSRHPTVCSTFSMTAAGSGLNAANFRTSCSNTTAARWLARPTSSSFSATAPTQSRSARSTSARYNFTPSAGPAPISKACCLTYAARSAGVTKTANFYCAEQNKKPALLRINARILASISNSAKAMHT
mmetsp:Transcript_2614/g.7099  ORF Transcript_2614/g.7099 Transcript_2614/m.7099 type:complete len:204 (-) Transcript_2614:142-753(-)